MDRRTRAKEAGLGSGPHNRASAPIARALTLAFYRWGDPNWVAGLSLLAAAPFILAAVSAPALLSFLPTAEMIAPIADARALLEMEPGTARPTASAALLLAADAFADAPGRIHLIAKALAAALVAVPMAILSATRLPALAAALLTGELAAGLAAPFSGPSDLALAAFLLVAIALLCPAARESPARARVEGVIAAGAMFVLWTLSPAFTLGGFFVLAVAPCLGAGDNAVRLPVALAGFAALSILAEGVAPGFNLEQARIAFSMVADAPAGEARIAGGLAASAAIVVACAAIVGGAGRWRGWGVAAGIGVLASAAAILAGADPSPALLSAAAIAAFTAASPFYEALLRGRDRAGVAIALAVAALTLFWSAAHIALAGGRLLMQSAAARAAPSDIRAELALVQPGAPTIARWVAEGRFSTPEARDLFALAPVDQSAILLDAAMRARSFAARGLNVAILTGADAACVIATSRPCRAGGAEAVDSASVVLVPRLDLDPATAAAKGKAEALLYTEFRLAELTPLWEIWIRRGAGLPDGSAMQAH